MDAALSIAAPSPAGLPAVVAAAAEADAEGSFAAALTLCLAAVPATAESNVPAPPVCASLGAPGAPPKGTAAKDVLTIPAPDPAPVQMPSTFQAEARPAQPGLSQGLPDAPKPVAMEPEGMAMEVEEERDGEPDCAAEALLPSLPPSETPVPVRPSRPPAAPHGAVATPLGENDGEESTPAVPLAWTPPLPPSVPPPPQAAIAPSSPGLKAAPPSSGGPAPLAADPVPEAEAPVTAPLPDMRVATKPGHAEALAASVPKHTAQPEAAPARPPSFPPELASFQAQSRVNFGGAAPPIALPPPSPARQVSSVAVALTFAPNGSSGFRLTLDPADLGRVEIQVQREGDQHSVRVIAERPETLALLQRDRHELDRGLVEAGLRLDSAGIGFSLETSGGGAGQEPGGERNAGSRGHAGGPGRPQAPEREPPRVLRSLLDLNI